jgi:hypothetical protein
MGNTLASTGFSTLVMPSGLTIDVAQVVWHKADQPDLVTAKSDEIAIARSPGTQRKPAGPPKHESARPKPKKSVAIGD